MKKQILLFAAVCIATLSSFAQFSFVHISDMHVSNTPAPNSDTNAQYFQCSIKEFANLNPKPSFVIASGDISDVGNQQPNGMYPTITQYLFPPTITNPAVGAYFIDSAKTIPVYFTPGNHEYWVAFDSIHIPISNDTLFYYPKYIARQATAFDTVANIYAPFYRQDNSSPVNRLNVIADIPTSDATAAFDYYIKHFNNGRPFILLGHSQGATILTNLLSGYLKNNLQVYNKMIAAYVIGSPITPEYLNENKHLKFATGPDDTGVIISWNTEAPDVTGVNPVLYGMVGLVINPINWKRDQTQATMAEGLGSLFPLPPLFTFVPVAQCADARVDTTKGVLISNILPASYQTILDIIDSVQGFPRGVYHTCDIPFFYFNLRQNAANRIQKFLHK